MPVVLLAARGLGQLAGWALLGWLMVIATLFVPHSDCTHRPAQPEHPQKRVISLRRGGAKVRAAARGISSDWACVSAPCLVAGGHFTFCAEAGKCQELGIRMRRGWRKVARCWVVKCAAAPGHGAALFISPLHRNQQLLRLSSGDGTCHHNPELKVFSLFK